MLLLQNMLLHICLLLSAAAHSLVCGSSNHNTHFKKYANALLLEGTNVSFRMCSSSSPLHALVYAKSFNDIILR